MASTAPTKGKRATDPALESTFVSIAAKPILPGAPPASLIPMGDDLSTGQRQSMAAPAVSILAKTRKRHKVATSCNRCRSNKRKCDGGVPCSNCKRNAADCIYTEAQQSRSTWGDSPLSQEKVQGVILKASSDNPTYSSASSRLPIRPSTSTGMTAAGNARPTADAGERTETGSSMWAGSSAATLPFSQTSLFNQGHASAHQAVEHLRVQDMLSLQSKQISKTMRVARQGPQLDLARLLSESQQGHGSLEGQPAIQSRLSLDGADQIRRGHPFDQHQPHPQASMIFADQAHLYSQPVEAMSASNPYPTYQQYPNRPILYQHQNKQQHQHQQQHELQQQRQHQQQHQYQYKHQHNHQPQQHENQVSQQQPQFSNLQEGVPMGGRSASDIVSAEIQSVLNQQQTADPAAESSLLYYPPSFAPYTTHLPAQNQLPQLQQQSSWDTAQAPSSHPNRIPVQGPAVSKEQILRLEQDRIEAKRMQNIARDMLDIQQYDYSIMVPRHISQERDAFWIEPGSVRTGRAAVKGVPKDLLVIPRDANYLVDVYFDASCLYYPIVNRAMIELHLMEPRTPHAAFMLNIIFMAACKHLGRQNDIRRAIQFRERAREVQHYIDSKARLSRIQASFLGSQVIYGVFNVIIGQAQVCGAHASMPKGTTSTTTTTTSSSTDNPPPQDLDSPSIDLEAEGRSIMAQKGMIPEAAYQLRLWTFWGLFARDSMARLYFGWPHGLDAMAITAELPKIRGCVGLGGGPKRGSGSTEQGGAVTGKRRDTPFKRTLAVPEKRHAASSSQGQDWHSKSGAYRNTAPASSEDEMDEDEDEQDSGDEYEEEQFRRIFAGADHAMGLDQSATQSSVPGLSRKLLGLQSQGQILPYRGRSSEAQECKRHLDRMKRMLEAEDDITDGGSYARVLFVEEIKLWSIGRRVALYLAGRSSFNSSGAGSFSPNPGTSLPEEVKGKGAGVTVLSPASLSEAAQAGRFSEQAWLQDRELQSLQADLIAWEKALPDLFRFRYDHEQPDVNPKVNAKSGVLILYYYTITIILQSSYLPIPQYLSSGESPVQPPRDSFAQETDNLFARTKAWMSSKEYNPSKDLPQDHLAKAANNGGYFNTAHRICSELANVLLHHVEAMMDRYEDSCAINCKIHHSVIASLRVTCLNARLYTNSDAIRNEAKAGFTMGSDLFKRLARTPAPLTVRDWPAEEDERQMAEIEDKFLELVAIQEEATTTTATAAGEEGEGDMGESHFSDQDEEESPLVMDPLAMFPESEALPLDPLSLQEDLFQTQSVFALGDEDGFTFEYTIDS